MIVIPVYEDVDVLDVTGPFEMFRWAGIDVLLAGETPGPIVCDGGLILHATTAFDEAPLAEVLWTPGGHPRALARLMANSTYLEFLVRQSKTARYVASVCEGALLLAAAGLKLKLGENVVGGGGGVLRFVVMLAHGDAPSVRPRPSRPSWRRKPAGGPGLHRSEAKGRSLREGGRRPVIVPRWKGPPDRRKMVGRRHCGSGPFAGRSPYRRPGGPD